MLQMLREKFEGIPIVEVVNIFSSLMISCLEAEFPLIEWNSLHSFDEPILNSTPVNVLYFLPIVGS